MALTTSKKLWISFTVILILLVAVSTICIRALFTLSDNYKKIIDVDIKKVDLAKNIQARQNEMGTAVLEFVTFGDNEALQKLSQATEQSKAYTLELMSLTTDAETAHLITELQLKSNAIYSSNEAIVSLKLGGNDYTSYASRSVQLNHEILTNLDQLIEIEQNNADVARENIEAHNFKMMMIINSLVTVCIIVGVIVAYYINKGISQPINKITKGLAEVAAGNLQVEPIYIKNKDEIGNLATTYNTMLNDLKGIVTNVRDSSTELAANAQQLSAGAEESLASSNVVTHNIEQQLEIGKKQITEINRAAEAMIQLNTNVMSIASKNDEMWNATSGVQSLITKGSDVVTDVASKMNELHTTIYETTNVMDNLARQSNDIHNVAGIITGIAKQINLLSLNAAIEASRAGEAGKGFAVVAEEIRHLAAQSKESATEIENIISIILAISKQAVHAINAGQERVDEGINKTTESLHVFKAIESSVRLVVEKVEQVSKEISDIHHMADNVTHNTTSVQQLTDRVAQSALATSAVTEEQLATTNEISSQAQLLATLAERLQNKVNHFKL